MQSKRQDVLDLTIFIDAFGWEILKKCSFLEDRLPYRHPLQTVFGYSSTCIPTILTGKMPQEHQHFSFFYYQPELSPFGIMKYLKYLPKELTRRGRVRRYMSRFIKKYYGYSGYFQIYNMPFEHLSLFDYSEKRDLYLPKGINSGANTFLDVLADEGVPFSLSDWRASEVANLEKVKEDIQSGDPRVAYVYLADLDAILHEHGTTSVQAKEKIEWYDRELRTLFDVADDNYSQVNITVFSDHGQANIHTVLPLIEVVEELNLSFGEDYVAVYDSTMARFWPLKEGVRDKIASVLSMQTLGHIMTDEELAGLGCSFPGNKYGEMFFVVDPGVLLCPSFLGEKPLAAMHGYLPDDKDSVAMIASNKKMEQPPNRLDDMYHHILKGAGVHIER